MATLEFGESSKTANEYIVEIQELLDASPPLTVTVVEGVLKKVSVETEWKEGETTPVESVDEDGNTVIDYEENYTEKSLTQAQINKLNTYMQENIVE